MLEVEAADFPEEGNKFDKYLTVTGKLDSVEDCKKTLTVQYCKRLGSCGEKMRSFAKIFSLPRS